VIDTCFFFFQNSNKNITHLPQRVLLVGKQEKKYISNSFQQNLQLLLVAVESFMSGQFFFAIMTEIVYAKPHFFVFLLHVAIKYQIF
jgi:hypothetical protein